MITESCRSRFAGKNPRQEPLSTEASSPTDTRPPPHSSLRSSPPPATSASFLSSPSSSESSPACSSSCFRVAIEWITNPYPRLRAPRRTIPPHLCSRARRPARRRHGAVVLSRRARQRRQPDQGRALRLQRLHFLQNRHRKIHHLRHRHRLRPFAWPKTRRCTSARASPPSSRASSACRGKSCASSPHRSSRRTRRRI